MMLVFPVSRTHLDCAERACAVRGLFAAWILVLIAPWHANGQEDVGSRPIPQVPVLAEASGEGASAIASFKKPEGWGCELFAAEPLVGNPVAFTIDGQGRIFVCESYRQGVGVTDNRSHDQAWLQADLSAMTVQDRIAYHRRLLGDKVAEYESRDDLIRLLIDRDGDRVADESKVFASGFNGLEEGTGAGAMVVDGRVYYTNIPNLWQLEDRDEDGTADERRVLATGFGVRVAFRGHDMHGLIRGPDGRLYFSIGDRGYHVETPEGTLSNPESGAVFRCELDGSGLEVVATGMRNPQELAFDDFGNLFTGDNNSDSGDRARWVHVVRGGDSGWRMMYQYLPDRGPFNRERIWYPFDDQTPAYIVPPVANLSDGPSGLVCYPGTGLGDGYRNSFFLVDFRGQASNSGIRRIQVEPQGAGFRVVANEEFLWNVLATDVDFAPDGAMVVSDWVNGWNGENKGRLYRFFDPKFASSDAVTETERWLREGVSAQSLESLRSLLSHPDRRVRLEAQYELASRDAVEQLLEAAADRASSTSTRLHGVWGLGQIVRRGARRDSLPVVVAQWSAIAEESEPVLAARTLEVMGDSLRAHSVSEETMERVYQALSHGLRSEHAVVQSSACLAAEHLKAPSLHSAVVGVLERNADRDPIVRHAAILALAGASPAESVVDLAQHASPSVRLAAVVALRRLKHEGIARFLDDPSLPVKREAVRAIHDVPELHSQLQAIAARIVGVPEDDAVIRRVLNANFRLGQPVHAQRLARFAASFSGDERYRLEALNLLGAWKEPGLNDRVMNRYLPLDERDPAPAAEAMRANLESLAASPERVRDLFLRLGARFGIQGLSRLIADSFSNRENAPDRRAAALAALAEIEPEQVRTLLDSALRDDAVEVRIAALKIAPKLAADRAPAYVETALASDEVSLQQAAWDSLRALEPSPEREAMVAAAWGRYLRGEIPRHSRLNALEAMEAVLPATLRDQWNAAEKKWNDLRETKPLAYYADSVEGGDVASGKLLFFTKASLSCVRCHKVGATGGEVGPNLSDIGIKKNGEYLLEAIVAPNAMIAEGFKTIIVQDDEGAIFSGIVKREDEETLVLLDAQGASISLPVETIVGRREGQSSMPADLIQYLSRRELRDLVAYLKSLDGTPAATEGVFEAAGGHGLE